MKWEKAWTTISAEGRTTAYISAGTNLRIESRLRHIPHANGVGTWDYTSYWLIDGEKEVKELRRLSDAKEYAAAYLVAMSREEEA